MSYYDPPVTTDPEDIARDAFAYLAANIPGWVPSPGTLEVFLIQAFAYMTAEAATVAAAVPSAIFRYFGQQLLALAPIDAAPATAQSTWTMVNTAGYTIPQGTVVGYRVAGDRLVYFRTTESVTVLPGVDVTAAGGVTLEAVEDGSDGNGLAAGPVELVDALAYVESIVTTTVSSGGLDPETDSEYHNRLVEELGLLSPRPILAADFAVLARRIPGVERALAIDNYNPNDSTTDNERMVTVALVDADGQPVSAGIKTAVDDLLESMRETNFVVWTMDPTYTEIDVTFTIKILSGYDVNDTVDAAEAAVADYLSPAAWGTTVDTAGNRTTEWRTSGTVRYLEVASLLNGVDGVDYVDSLLINGGANDEALTGAAPLPSVGTIAGTGT